MLKKLETGLQQLSNKTNNYWFVEKNKAYELFFMNAGIKSDVVRKSTTQKGMIEIVSNAIKYGTI